jgi:hypothetical protein
MITRQRLTLSDENREVIKALNYCARHELQRKLPLSLNQDDLRLICNIVNEADAGLHPIYRISESPPPYPPENLDELLQRFRTLPYYTDPRYQKDFDKKRKLDVDNLSVSSNGAPATLSLVQLLAA